MEKKRATAAKNDNTYDQNEAKLASLLQDFESLAQAASHDLKDPLRQAIIDFEMFQSEYLNKPLDNKANDVIHNAIAAINQVIHRITILRTYSFLVQNKKPFQRVDTNHVLQKALEGLRLTIHGRQATVITETLPELLANEEQLTLLFNNIVDNAIRFCPDRTPDVHISAQEKDGMWLFAVQDNGIGIPEVYRDFVFTIFQCLDNDSPKRSEGIGLTFCRKIVQNHGGRIWFESDGEYGTCFYFTLPKV